MHLLPTMSLEVTEPTRADDTEHSRACEKRNEIIRGSRTSGWTLLERLTENVGGGPSVLKRP